MMSWQRSLKAVGLIVAVFAIANELSSRSVRADEAPTWRYAWKEGDVFAYEITVSADRPDAQDQLSGVAAYTVKAVTDQQVELTFAGQLHRKETTKPAARTGGPRPGLRRPGGPGGPRGPMFRNEAMTGLLWQTNDMKLTKAGSVVSIKGTSYLPYLLGNLSLLPFESFPAEPKTSWQADLTATVVESGSESRMPFHRFFGDGSEKEKRTSASETVRYDLDRKNGNIATVRRTYDFKTVNQDGKGAQFSLQTNGAFDFDFGRSLTTQGEFKGQFGMKEDNVSVEVPLVVKLKLMTDSERKEFEEKRKAELADRQAKLKELQAKNAEKVAKPLTDAERNDIVKTLQTGRPANVMQTLMMLQKREPTPADKEVARAIKPLLEDKNGGIRRNATEAWGKWSRLLTAD